MSVMAKKTKNRLYSALLRITERRSVQDITVAELCREADVNRATFYKYYSVPGDVGREYISSVIDGTVVELRRIGDDTYPIMLENCLAIRRAGVNIANLAGNLSSLDDLVGELILRLDRDAELLSGARFFFISGGVSNILYRWCKYEPELPAESVARALADCVNKMK